LQPNHTSEIQGIPGRATSPYQACFRFPWIQQSKTMFL